MNARQILQNLSTKYAQCVTYSDSGRVKFDGDQEIQFRTEFARPDFLIFEWQDYGPRRGKSPSFSTLRTENGKTGITWNTNSQKCFEEQPSLNIAVARATGCSAGAAHKIPALLMDELRIGSKTLLEISKIELTEEILNDHACYSLVGSLLGENDYRLWVSKQDFALQKLVVTHSQTAQQAEDEHKKILSNVELIQRMAAQGITVPTALNYRTTHSTTEYTFTNIQFNQLLNVDLPDS